MKKIFGIIIAITMMVVLVACGSSGSAGGQTTKAAETEKATETTTAKKVDTSELKSGFKATIGETVLVDEAGVKITATELECSQYSIELKLKLENNSDQELSFYAGTLGNPVVYVNDYMVSGGYLNETIAPGMTANGDVSFTVDELVLHGIKEIGKIGMAFEIKSGYDEYLQTDVKEIKTSEDANYDYSKDTFMEAMDGGLVAAEYGYTIDYKTDENLYDGNGISTCCAYVITNKDGEQSLFMEVQNNSDEIRYACTNEINLNEICVCGSTWNSECIAPGKRAVVDICFDDVFDRTYLEALGMNSYGNIMFDLEAKDADFHSLGDGYVEIVFGDAPSPDDYNGEVLYDNNGFVFQKVGIFKDSFELSDAVHALFLFRNDNDQSVVIDSDYDGVYANSMKVSEITYTQYAHPANYALMDVELMEYDLEDNGLDFDSITDITVIFEIRNDDYDTLDTPQVTITK